MTMPLDISICGILAGQCTKDSDRLNFDLPIGGYIRKHLISIPIHSSHNSQKSPSGADSPGGKGSEPPSPPLTPNRTEEVHGYYARQKA